MDWVAIAAIVGVGALLVAMVAGVVGFATFKMTSHWNAYQEARNEVRDQLENERRLVLIEAQLLTLHEIPERVARIDGKMALMLGLPEDYLSKVLHNPWDADEQAALDMYMTLGAEKTPTPMLRILEVGIERKLKEEELAAGDRTAFVQVLTSVKAQLIDRDEVVHRQVLQ